MKSSEHHIKFQRTGRYFTHGDPEKADHLIVALHGYGHLAAYFIRKFNFLDEERYFIVCPEGMHRFYLKGTSGRVGASWMTKEDRGSDIQDNIVYLDAILEEIIDDCNFINHTLLGFSQGGATACRWLGHGKFKFDRFILWASVFPPDMEQENLPVFDKSSNYFVVGKKDEYYTEERIKEQMLWMKAQEVRFEFVNFDGDHNIDRETLLRIIE